MAESSLSLGFPDFQRIVGEYLRYGRDSSNWSTDETSQVDEIIQSGVRQYYFPPAIQNRTSNTGVYYHKWGFLAPTTATIVTVSATLKYDLPDNFGGIEGPLTFAQDEAWVPIPIVDEVQIRILEQRNSSGVPQFAAIRPKGVAGSTGQRWEITIWPSPDGVYNLSYRYNVLDSTISASVPYPLGGMSHAEGILQSIMAVAEHRVEEERGIQWQRFMELVTANIHRDMKNNTPEYYGYNRDGSDLSRHANIERNLPVTYKGVKYTG